MARQRNTRQNRIGVIGVRVSQNDKKDGHGTDAQLRVLRARAARDGVTIVGEYVEDGRSAWKRNVKRPVFDALIERLPEVDVWYAWSSDRIVRRCAGLETVLDLMDTLYNRPRGFEVITEIGGLWDVNDPSDRLRIRIGGAISEYESDIKSERSKLRHDELAREGKSAGGSRPYGFKGYRPETAELPERKNGMELEPTEVVEIEWMVERVLAGDSVCSITEQLNARGVPTTRTVGNGWRTATVRGILTGPWIAGLRQHKGKLYTAAWPAIITLERRAEILSLIETGRAATNPGKERKLMTGIARCGRCGGPMRFRIRSGSGRREYTCRRLPGEAWCDSLGIGADDLEELARRLLFGELAVEPFDAVNSATEDATNALADALAALDQRERELGKLLVNNPIAAEGALDEIASQRAILLESLAVGVVKRRTPINLAEVKANWSSYSTEQQRVAIQSQFRAFVIRPGRGTARQRAAVVGVDESDDSLESLIADNKWDFRRAKSV